MFGFTYQLCLATRPEMFLGEIKVWNMVEQVFKESINAVGLP